MSSRATENAPAAVFVLEEDDAGPVLHDAAGGRAALYSSRCPGKPTPNEDAALLLPLGPSSAVLAVADGLGGLPAGAEAARAAVKALEATVRRSVEAGLSLREAVLAGFDRANRAVMELALGAATTLAVAEIDGRSARVYHAGDSPALLVGGRGKVKLLTVAHSPVGYAVEAGLLDPKDAMHHAERHLVSNVLGTEEMRVEMSTARRLAPRDTLLLASDGLYDNLHTHEIANGLRKGPLGRALERLAAECRKRMETEREGRPSKPDDLTLVAFRPGR